VCALAGSSPCFRHWSFHADKRSRNHNLSIRRRFLVASGLHLSPSVCRSPPRQRTFAEPVALEPQTNSRGSGRSFRSTRRHLSTWLDVRTTLLDALRSYRAHGSKKAGPTARAGLTVAYLTGEAGLVLPYALATRPNAMSQHNRRAGACGTDRCIHAGRPSWTTMTFPVRLLHAGPDHFGHRLA